MESLVEKHINLIKRLNPKFRRSLLDEIQWNEQLTGILGARGVGKTTLLLQKIKETYKYDKTVLYISLDDIYFSSYKLIEVADQFYKKDGRSLFIDEIHKYQNWSQEVKNIYDSYPDLKVVFSGSSILQIHKGKADLSRRAVMYTLEGLSFRKYLEIQLNKTFNKYSLEDILKDHHDISIEITKEIKPLAYFYDYLKYGFYPYYLQGTGTYLQKLLNTINVVLETDIPLYNNVDLKYIPKLRQLLYMFAISVPFEPNISRLSSILEISRNTIMIYLEYLQNAKLINLLGYAGKGYQLISKPAKIYLNNTNLMYAIAPENVNIGSLRETFFYNQLNSIHKVESSVKGDFLVDGKYIFEVGGKNKTYTQIKDLKEAYIAADMIEHGSGNKIPLWLFGFLY